MKAALTLALLVVLASCAKDPKLAIDQAMAAGDRAQAQSLLEAALLKAPQRPEFHALHYAMTRDLALNGPEAGRSQALDQSIAEYEWLANHFGLAKDYSNSDASLRADPKAKALLDAAGKSLYR